MIFLITKLRIKRIASKDAKGQYGSSLIRRQISLDKRPSAKIAFTPSDWMISRAIDYKNTTERLYNDQKYMCELNSQIRQYHTRLLEAKKELDKKISERISAAAEISAEIAEMEKDMAETARLTDDFNAGKPLPNGMTSSQLMRSKIELEQKYSQKKAQKKSISDQSSVKAEYDELVKNFRDKVIQLESDFSLQIDLLYKKIRKREIRYNEQICCYWKNICKYIQKNKLIRKKNQTIAITERIKGLADFSELCGVNVLSREDLFESERIFMNDTINTAMGLEFKV